MNKLQKLYKALHSKGPELLEFRQEDSLLYRIHPETEYLEFRKDTFERQWLHAERNGGEWVRDRGYLDYEASCILRDMAKKSSEYKDIRKLLEEIEGEE